MSMRILQALTVALLVCASPSITFAEPFHPPGEGMVEGYAYAGQCQAGQWVGHPLFKGLPACDEGGGRTLYGGEIKLSAACGVRLVSARAGRHLTAPEVGRLPWRAEVLLLEVHALASARGVPRAVWVRVVAPAVSVWPPARHAG